MKIEYLPIIFEKLIYFIAGIVIIFFMAFFWSQFQEKSPLFDAATGLGSKTVEAKIVERKITNQTSNPKMAFLHFLVEFPPESGLSTAMVLVNEKEYIAYREGDKIKLRFHPANPDYFVTPYEDDSRFIGKLFIWGFMLVGVLIILSGVTKTLNEIRQKRLENL